MTKIGIVGSQQLAEELSPHLDVVSSDNAVTAAALSMEVFVALIVDSPDHPDLLAPLVDNLVSSGVRVMVFDCPRGKVASASGAVHLPRDTSQNMAVALISAGVPQDEAIKAAAVSLPAWEATGPTQPSSAPSVPAPSPEPVFTPEPAGDSSTFFTPSPVTEPVSEFKPTFIPESEPTETYTPAPTSFVPSPVSSSSADTGDYRPIKAPVRRDAFDEEYSAHPRVRPTPPPVEFEEIESPRRPIRPSMMDDTFTSSSGQFAPVVFMTGGKGGVLKTTLSILTAQMAGRRQVRATLIDANRGQADVATFLRMSWKAPTVFDYASGKTYKEVALTPKQISLNKYRPSALESLTFKLVLGPREGTSDASIVTSDIYRDAINAARKESGLVIVDTQMMEDSDNSGLFDEVYLPILTDSSRPAYIVFLTDPSPTSLNNHEARIRHVVRDIGVDPGRVLTALTQVGPQDGNVADKLQDTVNNGQLDGLFLGSVPFDETAKASQLAGRIEDRSVTYQPVINSLLYHVTGDEQFSVPTEAPRKKWWKRR